MTINLNGRVAIVTGAGGGLGREHSLRVPCQGPQQAQFEFAARQAALQPAVLKG